MTKDPPQLRQRIQRLIETLPEHLQTARYRHIMKKKYVSVINGGVAIKPMTSNQQIGAHKYLNAISNQQVGAGER